MLQRYKLFQQPHYERYVQAERTVIQGFDQLYQKVLNKIKKKEEIITQIQRQRHYVHLVTADQLFEHPRPRLFIPKTVVFKNRPQKHNRKISNQLNKFQLRLEKTMQLPRSQSRPYLATGSSFFRIKSKAKEQNPRQQSNSGEEEWSFPSSKGVGFRKTIQLKPSVIQFQMWVVNMSITREQSQIYKSTRKIMLTLLEKLTQLFTLLPRLCDQAFTSKLLQQVHSLQQIGCQKLFKTPISKLIRHYQCQWEKMTSEVSRLRPPILIRRPQQIFASLPPTRKHSEVQPVPETHKMKRGEFKVRLKTQASMPTQFNENRDMMS